VEITPIYIDTKEHRLGASQKIIEADPSDPPAQRLSNGWARLQLQKLRSITTQKIICRMARHFISYQ
jgi:hypothetical protein